MKLMLCLVVVGLAIAKPTTDEQQRGCRYIMGTCVEPCPVGTHAYTTGCGHLMPEATCKDPTPVQDSRGVICDFSSCYCDAPTVRDEKTGHCVSLETCTKGNFSEIIAKP